MAERIVRVRIRRTRTDYAVIDWPINEVEYAEWHRDAWRDTPALIQAFIQADRDEGNELVERASDVHEWDDFDVDLEIDEVMSGPGPNGGEPNCEWCGMPVIHDGEHRVHARTGSRICVGGIA